MCFHYVEIQILLVSVFIFQIADEQATMIGRRTRRANRRQLYVTRQSVRYAYIVSTARAGKQGRHRAGTISRH